MLCVKCFVDDGAGEDAGSSQLELGGLHWCYTGTDGERAELAATAKSGCCQGISPSSSQLILPIDLHGNQSRDYGSSLH